MLVLLALLCLALPMFSFSLLPTTCLLPLLILSLCFRYWWFLSTHPEHLFNIIRMHYTIVISSFPEPSRSSILAFRKPWYHSLWIPCGFLVDSDCSTFYIHLLIVKSSSINVTTCCFYLSWYSYSLLSLSEELSAYFFEAFLNPFMMTTSSYSIPLSASLLLDLSHGS